MQPQTLAEPLSLSPSEQRALEALESIFDGENWLEQARDYERALALLQRYPRLVNVPVGILKQRALHHFLQSPVASRLEVIQAVYQVSLPAEQTTNILGNIHTTPLHVACQSDHATDEVIEFIFCTDPIAALVCNAHELTPLVYLFMTSQQTVRSPPKLNLLRMCLEACPDFVKATAKSRKVLHKHDLLATAMSIGCPSSVYQLLWEHYPVSTTFELCSNYHVGQDRLGLPEAQILCQMMPHLTSLVCQPQEWACEQAIEMVCQGLTHCTSIVELDISLTPENSIRGAGFWKTLLQNNNTLRKLKINAEAHSILKLAGQRPLRGFRSMVSNRMQDDAPLLQTILQGLNRNNTLQELELSSFKFPDSPLPALLVDNLQSCQSLQKLRFTHCYMPSFEWLKQGFLSVAPNLQDLTVTFRQNTHDDTPRPPDMTPTLVNILDHCHSLESLTVGKVDLSLGSAATQVDEFLQALQRNTSLHSLSIHSMFEDPRHTRQLEALLKRGGNATLYDIAPSSFGYGLYSSWDYCSPDDTPELLGRIPYYLQWNRFGRHAARQQDMSKADFVQLLCRVNERATPNDKPRKHQHDLLLDLLLESPSLWTEI